MQKTILIVGTFLSGKGYSRALCEDLADQLQNREWKVIKTSSEENRFRKLIDMFRTTWVYRKDYHSVHIDVFSGVSFVWAEIIGILLVVLRKPFVLTLRGGGLPEFAKRNRRRMLRLLRSASEVTTPSNFLKELMSTYRSDIQLVSNPLDLPRYKFVLRDKPKPHLIWLRAFHEIYNPSMALRVLTRLLEEFPDARLTMIGHDKGDGSLQKIEKEVIQLDLIGQVDIIKGVSKGEVPGYLNTGDIFINTTNVDNTPVSVIEAMACGLCVVSTDVGGIPFLLQNGKDSFLIPKGSDKAMADAVKRLLNNDDDAAMISENARLKAEQFDWDLILPIWEKLFRRIM